jgi:amino acid adenylation domain-containing protein
MSANPRLDPKALKANKNIAARNYWKNRLQDMVLGAWFNSSQVIPTTPAESLYANYSLKAATEVYQSLHTIASADKAKHIVLLSALAVLTHKYASVEDLTLFTPVYAGGQPPETGDQLIPVRIKGFSGLSFRNILSAVKTNLVQDLNNSDYPLERMVNKESGELKKLAFAGMLVKTLQPVSVFDTFVPGILFSFDTAGGLTLNIRFDESRYEAPYICRLPLLFFNLLHQLLLNPDKCIDEISILPEQDRQQMQEFNCMNEDDPVATTVMGLFEEQVNRTPDQTALELGERVMSYRQLNTAVNKLAALLVSKGVKTSTPVAILLERSMDYVISLLAIVKAGGICIPVDPYYEDEYINYLFENSKTNHVVTRQGLLPARDLQWPAIQVCVDRQATGLAGYTIPQQDFQGNQPLFIQYTPDEPATPDGVVMTQAAVLNSLYWIWQSYPWQEGEVACQKTSPALAVHITEILSSLLKGIPLVIAGEEEGMVIEKLTSLIINKRISRIFITPVLLKQLVKAVAEKSTGLRYVFCSGELLTERLARDFYTAFPQSLLMNVYHAAEVGIVAGYQVPDNRSDNHTTNQPLPIGKPVSNIQVQVLDQHQQALPVGVPGHIWLYGKDVDRAFRSAYTGKWLEDGSLVLLGRVDRLVKISDGAAYRPEEIEQVLTGHDEITDAIVMAGEQEGEKYLAGYYTSPTTIKATAIKNYLVDHLPAYMIPTHFMRMDTMPVRPGGGVDITLLPDPGLQVEEKFQAPSNEWEEKLADIWADILKIDRHSIGVNASFFRMGGHSLRAITLVNKIHGAFGIDISVKEVFKRKSIANLSKLLQASKRSGYTQFKKAEEREYYSLSIAQLRLYYLHELDHASLSLNIPTVIKLEGALDKDRLQAAFYQLIMRQESLRTSFRVINEQPVQMVAAQVDFEVAHFYGDTSEVDAIAKQFIRPFNLAKPPLFRVGLIETGPEEFYLMVDIHHIITDGTSMGLLVNDFMSLYNQVEMEPLSLHYKDYATWQQSAGYQKKAARQKDFWIGEFTDPIIPLDLPVDFVRPARSESDGEVINFDMGPEETSQLRAIAEAEVATTSMVLLAALNIVLGKMANQQDLVIGMAVAGREEFALDNMIGMFPVVLPLRNRPRSDSRFTAFLASLKTKFLSALDNQGYPYEELAKELKMERSTSRNPWFDVMFLYQNFEKPELVIPGLKVSLYKDKNIVAQEKLNISVTENEQQLFFRLVYSRLLFKKETIERFVRYFKQTINSILSNKDIEIGDIDLAPARRKACLPEDNQDTQRAINRQKTFTDLFLEQVAKTPGKVAVVHNEVSLTYEALRSMVDHLSALVLSAGIQGNQNILLFMPRGVDMLGGILTAFQTGCAYVPVDTEFPLQRVKEVLVDSEPAIVLVTRETWPVIKDLLPLAVSVRRVICVDQLEELPAVPAISRNRSMDDLAYIIYTSGTTGRPKGVMIHQLGLINHLYAMIDVLTLGENDTIAQTASPCFDISVWQFLTALITGGTTCIIDNEKITEPVALLKELQQKTVTIFQSVPSLMGTFLDELSGEQERSLTGLRWMIPTGEPLTVALVRKWYTQYPYIPLLNAYGPAEASDDVTTHVVKWPEEGQLAVPVGKAVQNMEVYILDDMLKECPAGVKGEICVAGWGVGKGYWKDEEKTKRAFVPNPLSPGPGSGYEVLYKTGDIGFCLDNGDIVCLGRKDDQVKVRGFRIELGEIEGQFLRHEQVREVAILAREWHTDKYLVAYYVAERPISVAELEAWLADKLPYYMIPSYFVHLEELPVTLNGKLDRRALPDPEIRIRDEYIAPVNEMEERLVAIWAVILKTGEAPISTDTSFFYIGGHSLNAITLINKIYKEFNVKLSLKEFFLKPTVKGIAAYIAAHLWLKKEAVPATKNKTEVLL